MARCLGCGFENPAGFRFCGQCGSRLETAAADEEERKVVTALFCDVAGFTHRAERLDPEDVHRLLAPYYRALRAELERFGGTVEKFIGDAVFGLFGAPRAHGDDPERAVRAALAIRDVVADLNERDPELALHLRIGVTTGEAVVELRARPSDGEGMAWGDVLNTSARLQAAAPVDGILVDEATYRATRHVIEYGVTEPIRAKGKAEPIPVWQAIGPRARRGLDLTQISQEPFVGRRDELALLLESLYRCRLHRAPELLTLVGEPGIGKSRLVFELFRKIETGPMLITWRHGRSLAYGDGFAFWALGEIVKGQAGILETDSAAAAAAKLGRAVGDLVSVPAEAARIEAHLRSLVGLGSELQTHGDQRGAAFAAWRHFFEALARQRPLVLVFEDIQWADDGLLDFLEHLLDWARDVSILLVCSARPELFHKRRGWGTGRNAATLHLAPLSQGEMAELVSMLVGDASLSAETAEAIVSGASGNPLYAGEMVRMLADRRLLSPSPGETGPRPGEALPLPESLQGIIAARLDSLPPEEKALLQNAAVVGRVVWPGALATISGRSRRWVERRLSVLVRNEFLARSRPSSVAREHEYQFRHILVRDVAYGQIPRGRRGEIHRRAAEWLESLSPDRTADRAEMLAHHYATALQLARALGQETAFLTERARMALRDAGEKARMLQAFPAAARFYAAALELWPDEDPERPAILFRVGEARYHGETGGGSALEEARDRLLEAGELAMAAEAEALVGWLAHHRGEQGAFLEHVERAVELVEDLAPSRFTAAVLLDLAGALIGNDEEEKAIDVSQQLLEIVEQVGPQELRASAHGLIGTARSNLGHPDARGDLERCIALAEEIDSHVSAFGYGNLADLVATQGDLRRSFDLQRRGLYHAERVGHAPYVRWFETERVAECYWSGGWDEAVKLADALIAAVEAGSPNFEEGLCRQMRGRIRLARGDPGGALDDSASALEFGKTAARRSVLYPALAFRARSLLDAGSRQDAEALADELLARWNERLDVIPSAPWWLGDLAFVLEALDRGHELNETVALVRTQSRWLDAASAFAAGNFSLAADLYADIGSLPDEAVARLRAGEQSASVGHLEEADAEAGRALAFFRRVQATAYVQKTEAVLADLAGL